EPGGRIDGPVWLSDEVRFYRNSSWPAQVRQQLLEDLGVAFGGGADPDLSPARHPHPLAGRLTFGREPRGQTRRDLEWLRIPWRRSKTQPRWPRIDFRAWRTYRVYDRGFEYQAEPLPARLAHQTLRPSPNNPLGIFYRDGNLCLGDEVVVQGTLVVRGRVEFVGRSVYVGSFNWRGADGRPMAYRSDQWPRLPAIVADCVRFTRQTRSMVEGAILVRQSVQGAGGNWELPLDPSVAYEAQGQATSRPLGQPLSRVQIDPRSNVDWRLLASHVRGNRPDRTSVSTNQRSAFPTSQNVDYAIWLTDGPTGNWYPIVEVVPDQHALLVVGEVEHRSWTSFRIRPHRRHYVDVRGMIAGRKHTFDNPRVWHLSGSAWQELWMRWKSEAAADGPVVASSSSTGQSAAANAPSSGSPSSPGGGASSADLGSLVSGSGASGGTGTGSGSSGSSDQSRSFLQFLADPATFSDWDRPYSTYGLTVEPTFHLRRMKRVYYRWSPPVFRAFADARRHPDQSGYRWEVLSWREM
ncbi:MAG: hypothetical protein GXP27_16950, partial [Planctomycetes bacterium]|nr:hypothetical protein [Planctomycetota bacterium]